MMPQDNPRERPENPFRGLMAPAALLGFLYGVLAGSFKAGRGAAEVYQKWILGAINEGQRRKAEKAARLAKEAEAKLAATEKAVALEREIRERLARWTRLDS